MATQVHSSWPYFYGRDSLLVSVKTRQEFSLSAETELSAVNFAELSAETEHSAETGI